MPSHLHLTHLHARTRSFTSLRFCGFTIASITKISLIIWPSVVELESVPSGRLLAYFRVTCVTKVIFVTKVILSTLFKQNCHFGDTGYERNPFLANELLHSKNLLRIVSVMTKEQPTDDADKNKIAPELLADAIQRLRVVMHRFEKQAGQMKELGIESIVTSNWDSSGERGIVLLERACSANADAIENYQAELIVGKKVELAEKSLKKKRNPPNAGSGK